MDVDFVAALINERKKLSEELKLEIYREDISYSQQTVLC